MGTSQDPLINAYLVDLRESRRLRSNEVRRRVEDGVVTETPAPYRVDCHYLISVWSPASAGQALEPTLDEHEWLGAVIVALGRAGTLRMSDLFDSASLPPGTPPELLDHEMPLSLLPVEGYPKLVEFWGTMGEQAPVKPVAYVVITAPFFASSRAAGPPVTTITTTYRQPNELAGEVLHEIGGLVGDSARPLPDGSPAPVADAWVELFNPAGLRLRLRRSGPDGRFTFGRLPAGGYTVRTSHEKLGTATREMLIPSPTGDYSLTY